MTVARHAPRARDWFPPIEFALRPDSAMVRYRLETSLKRLKCVNTGHSPRVLRAVNLIRHALSSKAPAQLPAGRFGETGRAGLSDLSQPAQRC